MRVLASTGLSASSSWRQRAPWAMILLALNGWLVPAALGQPTVLGTVQERESTLPNGFQLDEVDLSGAYSSVSGGLDILGPGILALQGYSLSAAVSTSYVHHGPFSNFSVTYSPSFTNLFRFSRNYWNHALAINLDRRMGSQWVLHLTGSGRLENAQQFLFLPQGSIDTSSGAIGVGYTPTLLTGSEGLLFGTRILTFGVNARAIYSPTRRFHLTIEGQGSEIISRPEQGAPTESVVPRARLAGAVLSADFNATPRTSYGADAFVQEGWTVNGHYQSTDVGMHVGRKLGQRWYVSAFGGYGWTTSVGGTNLSGVGNVSATGKISYQARQSSWTVAYHRQAGDAYGFGSSVTNGYSTTWDWHSLNRGWGLQVTGDRSQLAGGVGGGINLWDAGTTLSRGLGRKLALGVGASYLREGLAQGGTGQANVYSGRMVLSWIPFLRDTMPLDGPSGQSDLTPP